MKEIGPGISSYHKQMMRLFLLFALLTIIHIPVIFIYGTNNFYDDSVGFIMKRSVGNLGYSQTHCESTSLMNSQSHSLECKTGSITSLESWSILTSDENHDTCVRKDNGKCNQFLDDKKFKDTFNTDCMNKTNCVISDLSKYMKHDIVIANQAKCSEFDTRFFI